MLLLSLGHVVLAPMPLKLLSAIKNDVPRGKNAYFMGAWLKINWIRAVLTNFPASIFFIVEVLRACDESWELRR